MVKEVCHAEVLEKISYQITLTGRAWSQKTYGAPFARESSGESFFLRILSRSFSFSKVSKSSTTVTKYSKYKVKKVQTLESINREQDVISSLVTYYYISHTLTSHWRTGRIFRSKATWRNRVLKHMTKNKCLTYFWKGLTLWCSLHTAESEVTSGKRRRTVFFSFLKRDVLKKFMLYVVVVRSAKGKTLHELEITPNGTAEK